MGKKTRYSDAELEEFRAIIQDKLEKAYKDYELLKASVMTPLPHSKFWKRVQRLSPKKKPGNWLSDK